jgi:NADPH-dependent 2,4-dienoyl-CoA reductase/sulfur reductase-like enzyme
MSPDSHYDVETSRYRDPDVVETTDVLVVGAGPAGLMLAFVGCNLV